MVQYPEHFEKTASSIYYKADKYCNVEQASCPLLFEGCNFVWINN